MENHHPAATRHRTQPVPSELFAVTCITNPVRSEARYRHYREFRAQCARAGVRLLTIEGAFGERPFEVTSHDCEHDVQVRVIDELWHKENLLNLAISRLPPSAQYVAWIDADVTFTHPHWAIETVHQLQHHPIVQMFGEAHDLAPDGTTVTGSRVRSFGWSHVNGIARPTPAPESPCKGYDGGKGPDRSISYYHHPGYAWAARRSALDAVGGLLDVAIVGEADYLMAKAIVGEAEEIVYPGVHQSYRDTILAWQERAKVLRKDIGYVPGTIVHHWHGRKADRQYWSRKRVLVESGFNPHTDLRRDSQGVYRLQDDGTDRFVVLRNALRRYFRNRNEDSIDP
jgi:hypothetical protein